MTLAKRQAAILECIERHLNELQYPPTIREMMADTGIPSESIVAYHLDKLAAWGYIERDPVARGIRLLRGADGDRRALRIERVPS
jgi:SOS-response transcriptional repressor LexA